MLAAVHADGFVAAICAASDVVLFAAAIRHQGGEHHVNEQWQSYWVEKFTAQGYDCYDVIRPAVYEVRSLKSARLNEPTFRDCTRIVRRYMRATLRRAVGG